MFRRERKAFKNYNSCKFTDVQNFLLSWDLQEMQPPKSRKRGFNATSTLINLGFSPEEN